MYKKRKQSIGLWSKSLLTGAIASVLWGAHVSVVLAAPSESGKGSPTKSSPRTESARADETAPTRLTLNEAVARALMRSELLLAGRQRITQFQLAGEQSAAYLNPEVSLEAGRKLADGSGSIAGVRFSQPFFFPGKTDLRQQIYQNKAAGASLSLENRQLALRLEIIRLAYKHRIARQKAMYAEQRLARFELMRAALFSRPVVSPMAQAERDIVIARLALLQTTLARLKSDVQNSWRRLNLFLQLKDPIEVEAPWFRVGPALNERNLRERALTQSPDLRKDQLAVAGARLEKRLAEKAAYPDFAVSGFYGREVVGQSRENVYTAGITFSLPVVNRNRAAIGSLEARIRAETAQSTFRQRQLLQNVSAAYARYESAKEVLRQLPIARVQQLELQLQRTDAGFRRGRVNLLTYLEAEAQNAELRAGIYDIQMDFVRSYLELLYLSNDPEFTTEDEND